MPGHWLLARELSSALDVGARPLSAREWKSLIEEGVVGDLRLVGNLLRSAAARACHAPYIQAASQESQRRLQRRGARIG